MVDVVATKDVSKNTILREVQARASDAERLSRVIGSTPREHLAWLVEFAYGDAHPLEDSLIPLVELIPTATRGWVPDVYPRKEEIVRTTGTDRSSWTRRPRWEQEVLKEARKRKVPAHLPRPDVAAIQDLVREAQAQIRNILEDVEARKIKPLGIHAKVMVGLTESGLRTVILAPLPLASVVATLALLAEVPETLLRRCPYEDPKTRKHCGRLFVGRKSQRWCSTHRRPVRLAQFQKSQRKRREKGAK